MTVFNTYLKILNKNKVIVIIYTVILLVFGGMNMQTSEQGLNFVANKPDILIVNNDENIGITKNFIDYLTNNSNIIDVENSEEARDDALFYNKVDYIIYIPAYFHKDFLDGKDINIDIKKSNNYNSEYANMLINKYFTVARLEQNNITDEEELISKIDDTLSKNIETEIVSKLDNNSLNKTTFYFNFSSYSILACLIYIICLIMSVFHNDKIRKRTIISSSNYKKNNKILLLSNYLYAFVVWFFYSIIGFILLGKIMFTSYGLLYLINLFIFTVCATTLSFLIGTLISKKEAISGIMNVVALGSSFLCGAFVPVEYLPSFVLKIGHIFPTSYFIDNNKKIKLLENINFETLKPFIINIIIMLIFSITFILLSNIIEKKKRTIN